MAAASTSLVLNVDGLELTGKAQRWEITGQDRWAHNVPGQPRQVDIEQMSFEDMDGELKIHPLSVTLYTFEVKEK
ncbi:MAG: hypothetical protein ACRD1R_15525 [Acidobacteriota bacterium]